MTMSFLRIITKVHIYARSNPNQILLQSSVASQQQHRLFQNEVAKQLTKFTDKRKQYVKTGTDFNDLIYSGKSDADIDKLCKWIKTKNKYIMDPDKSWKREFVSTSVLKFLSVINKPDKAIELFSNEEFGGLFMNIQCIQILLSQLFDQKKIDSAVQVFERFLREFPGVAKDNETTEKTVKKLMSNGSLFEVVDAIFKVLYDMGTAESLQQMNGIEEILKSKHAKFLPVASVIRLVLLSVQQNKMELVHDNIVNYPDDVLSVLVKKNLLVISKSHCSKLDEALDELEKLIKSKFDTSLVLFPDTVKHLKEALEKTEDADKARQKERLDKLLAVCSQKNLIKTITLIEFAEKKMVRQRRPVQTNKSEKAGDQALEKKPAAVKKKQLSNDAIYDSIQRLYSESKFSEIAALTYGYQGSEEFLRGLTNVNLSLLTSALFMTNTPASFEQMKLLLDTCQQKGITLQENSKLQAFLMACFQRQPNYALGISVMTGISEMSPTLFKNLKVIAYSEYGNLDKALCELEDILKIVLNIFSNEGFAYRSAVDYLEQATKKSNDTDLMERFSALKSKLMEEDRIPLIDLADFCSTSVQNKKTTKEFLAKQLTGTSPTSLVKTASAINRNVEELLTEYIKEDSCDYNNLSKKATSLARQLSKNPEVWHRFDSQKRFKITQAVAHAIRNDSNLDMKGIRGILEPMEKLNIDLSSEANVYSLLDIFLRLIQFDPIYALDLINTHGRLQQDHPGLFANILCIGLSLLDTVDLAMSQMESVLTLDYTVNKKAKRLNLLRFEGKVFPMAVNLLKDAVERSGDPKHLAQFKDLVDKINESKRMAGVDLPSLSSRK